MPTDKLSEADYHELLKYREPHAPSREEYNRLVSLKRRGFVKLNHFAFAHPGRQRAPEDRDTWIITPAGKDALSKFEEVRRKEAEEERRYEIQRQQTETQISLSRQQTRLTLIQTVIALVSFIAGLVVEHYVGLLGLLTGLFGG